MPVQAESGLVRIESALVAVGSAVVLANSAVVETRPGLSATAPAATTDLPSGLPSGFFTVAARAGEVGRMWVVTGTPESNYAFGEDPRPVVGSAYRNTFEFFPDVPINAIRCPSNTIRLHNASGTMSTYILANDGTGDEPDLALFIYTGASTFSELKFSDVAGSPGSGFVNWSTGNPTLTALRTALLTANTQAILVLANATS